MRVDEKFRMRIGVYTLYILGMSQSDIARLYEVSRQRIGQIIHGYRYTKGLFSNEDGS